MKSINLALAVTFLTGALGLGSVAGAEGLLLKVSAAPASNYCHMKFPAIEEATLFTDKPVLKDASTKDIVDFYGSCSHDPLGKEEVSRQIRQIDDMRWNDRS